MKRIITCLLVAIFEISSSYAQQSAKESPGNNSTPTNQPQQPASVAQVPAGPVAQATSVGQVITHQPETKVLQNHAQPEKPDEQDYKLGVFGIHIKLDSLIAIAALLVSGLAYWNSRLGVREANRIANEALQLSKAAFASERASDIQWSAVKLAQSSIGDGKNNLVATLKNFGKAPAAILDIQFEEPLHSSEFKGGTGITHAIGPSESGELTFSMHVPEGKGDPLHFGQDHLLLAAIATVKDESSTYTTRAIFRFDTTKIYGFAFVSSKRD